MHRWFAGTSRFVQVRTAGQRTASRTSRDCGKAPALSSHCSSSHAADVLPWAKEVARQRRDEFFRTRPDYQCVPAGPEAFRGMKRVLQTPTALVIENENQTYRHIFTDGRTLEASPYPTWDGIFRRSGDGDTSVIDSVGFNDRTWLNNAGLPHTEDFRMPSDGGVKLLAVCESRSRTRILPLTCSH
jgi:hypothetical protein